MCKALHFAALEKSLLSIEYCIGDSYKENANDDDNDEDDDGDDDDDDDNDNNLITPYLTLLHFFSSYLTYSYLNLPSSERDWRSRERPYTLRHFGVHGARNAYSKWVWQGC